MRLDNRASWFLSAFLMFALLTSAVPAFAKSVLDRIERTGQVNVGLREDAPPFGYHDKSGKWVGFSVDIAQRLTEDLSRKFNKPIKLIKKTVNSKTRIPMVAGGEIDIEIGTTTITLAREDSVDFTLPFFITGARILVPKGSPIREVSDLGGKKVGVAQGTTNAKSLEMAMEKGLIKPKCDVIQFADHAEGFLALTQGKLDAYYSDASILSGLKIKEVRPDDWVIVGQFISYEPYGFMVPANDSKWRDFVNASLIRLIKSGEFNKIYEKWMGPSGEVPMPMTEDYKMFLNIISFPE